MFPGRHGANRKNQKRDRSSLDGSKLSERDTGSTVEGFHQPPSQQQQQQHPKRCANHHSWDGKHHRHPISISIMNTVPTIPTKKKMIGLHNFREVEALEKLKTL
jgi:hypothetical protein